MADVTVKQLADTVGTPTDRLLTQMHDAGLPHKAEEELVNDEQKQKLLAFLRTSHGDTPEVAKKITLKRKETGTLKAGQGRTGRNVTVEVRRKRVYVKREEEVEQAGEAEPSQLEIETQKIHDEELARAAAEEQERNIEAERKAEVERKAEEQRLAAEAQATELKKQQEEAQSKEQKPEPEAEKMSAADVQAKE
ncbi:MAG: translation initiation factor IF-2, partial [Candidatus Azotimanducaceae bacterium]